MSWVFWFVVLAVAVVAALLIWWFLIRRPEEDGPQAPPAPVAEVQPPDDLRRIEGVGPKISGLLSAAGITTFAQLAATDTSRLVQILKEADLSGLADPGSWPEQARLAADGAWDALAALQEELKGGQRA